MSSYAWTGGGDGVSWGDPNNWSDLSYGQNPAKTAPGSNDEVTFSSPADITDQGAASSLTVNTTLDVDGEIDVTSFGPTASNPILAREPRATKGFATASSSSAF
jgi:hypothetical protein